MDERNVVEHKSQSPKMWIIVYGLIFEKNAKFRKRKPVDKILAHNFMSFKWSK